MNGVSARSMPRRSMMSAPVGEVETAAAAMLLGRMYCQTSISVQLLSGKTRKCSPDACGR